MNWSLTCGYVHCCTFLSENVRYAVVYQTAQHSCKIVKICTSAANLCKFVQSHSSKFVQIYTRSAKGYCSGMSRTSTFAQVHFTYKPFGHKIQTRKITDRNDSA